jgi:hypothetical protein
MSMIFSENRFPLFRIMRRMSMIFSENRFPLFRIMLTMDATKEPEETK